MAHVLVLACDLVRDGTELGPKTVLRLEKAWQYAMKSGDRVVVAASWSPAHPQQSATMAHMMADWLSQHGVSNTIVLEAPTFNTRGELGEFFKLPDVVGIVSAPWHLRRVRLLVWQLKGWRFMRSLTYIPVNENTMTVKEMFFLEPVKMLVETLLLFVPARYRDRLRDRGTSFVRRFVNTSW